MCPPLRKENQQPFLVASRFRDVPTHTSPVVVQRTA
jgi:hypothetical protein